MSFAANDILRVTAKMSYGINDIQNVFHARMNTASSETDAAVLDDVAAELESIWANIYGALTTNLHFDTVAAYNLTADRYLGETSWPTLTAGGYAAGQDLPTQLCGLIRFTTATLGSQGRKFIGGLKVALLDNDGSFTAAMTNAMTLMAASALNGFAGADYNASWGNYHLPAGLFRPWTFAIVNDYAAVQRRRKPGIGS